MIACAIPLDRLILCNVLHTSGPRRVRSSYMSVRARPTVRRRVCSELCRCTAADQVTCVWNVPAIAKAYETFELTAGRAPHYLPRVPIHTLRAHLECMTSTTNMSVHGVV